MASTGSVGNPRIGDRHAASRKATQRCFFVRQGTGDNLASGINLHGLRIREIIELIDIASEVSKRRVADAQLVGEAAAPFQLAHDTIDVLVLGLLKHARVQALRAVNARKAEQVGVPLQVAAKHRVRKYIVVVDDRVCVALRLRCVVKQQPAEVIGARREIVPVGLAGKVNLIDAVGEQDVVELVVTAEGVVAFKRHIPAEFPPARQRELAACFHAATPTFKVLAVGDRCVQVGQLLVDALELDRVFAVGETVPPVALPQHALV